MRKQISTSDLAHGVELAGVELDGVVSGILQGGADSAGVDAAGSGVHGHLLLQVISRSGLLHLPAVRRRNGEGGEQGHAYEAGQRLHPLRLLCFSLEKSALQFFFGLK